MQILNNIGIVPFRTINFRGGAYDGHQPKIGGLENDEFSKSDSALETEQDKLKRERAEKKRIQKERKREDYIRRSLEVGLDPDVVDYNKLMKWERAKKVGLDPETCSYKDIEYMENRNQLLRQGIKFRVDFAEKGIDPSKKIDLQKLSEAVNEAESAIHKKIICLALGLPESTSEEELDDIIIGMGEAEDMYFSEKLFDFMRSGGDLNSIKRKKDEEHIIFYSEFRDKTSALFDAVDEERISIDDIEGIIKTHGQKSVEEFRRILCGED